MVPSAADVSATEEERDLMKDFTHRNLLRCLLYISIRCRPDFTFTVTILSQSCKNPSAAHWKSFIKVLIYRVSTKEISLKLTPISSPLQLAAFSDAPLDGLLEDHLTESREAVSKSSSTGYKSLGESSRKSLWHSVLRNLNIFRLAKKQSNLNIFQPILSIG